MYLITSYSTKLYALPSSDNHLEACISTDDGI